MTSDFRRAALQYHSEPVPGKTGTAITKPASTEYDLSLSYTPGVAEPVKEIAANADHAYRYTNKGNLVAVITNGTAVLGLGDVGPLASKPVMEGKAVLFKHLANVDVFDIEIACEDPAEFVETVARIAPTFGGINLEDIKAPECFLIEQSLRELLDIPVMHDDQHGTAIVIAAGLYNALELQGKTFAEARIVCLGAGAAGIATMRLLLKLGANRENMLLVDRVGVIHSERKELNAQKQDFAIHTAKRTLADALDNADVFIGVSGPGLLTAELLITMAPKPIVFALSNPVPEIMPELAHQVRSDLIMATGRSDFPNQVNNALCFPYLFRGALDVRASAINDAMQLAAVHAIKDLAKLDLLSPQYILPRLMDPRLKEQVSAAVSQAAITSGVARHGRPS